MLQAKTTLKIIFTFSFLFDGPNDKKKLKKNTFKQSLSQLMYENRIFKGDSEDNAFELYKTKHNKNIDSC